METARKEVKTSADALDSLTLGVDECQGLPEAF